MRNNYLIIVKRVRINLTIGEQLWICLNIHTTECVAAKKQKQIVGGFNLIGKWF